MSPTIIALRASFRPRSNSTRLLECACDRAHEAGARVEVVDLTKVTIRPCRACDACAKTGRCRFTDDDFMPLLDRIMAAGRLLIATPIYYMAAPAQLKLFIDRTQCLYHEKYTLKRRRPREDVASRRGALIAVCGSRLTNAFDGLELTMKYLFDSLQMTFADRLYAQHVDTPGEVESHPELCARAGEIGARLAAPHASVSGR